MSNQSYSDLLHIRFHDLLISYDFARNHNGLDFNFDDEIELDGEADDRELLAVEQQAKLARDNAEQTKIHNQAQQAVILNQTVSQLVTDKLQDTAFIFDEVLQIQDAIPTILDILSVRAASIGRIDPLVSSLPWLSLDLIKLVNLPVYRKQVQGEKPIRVDRSKTALSYIGLDNLKMVIPSFALRKWIPHSTEPFRLMKRKLWESSLGAGIACKRLAQLYDQDPGVAFALGAFHDLGKSAIARLYLHTFDNEWKSQLKAARDQRQKSLHDALVDLEPDPTTLRDLMLEHSTDLSVRLVERFKLKRLNLASPLTAYVKGGLDKTDEARVEHANHQAMADILKKGICYARYKILQRHGLIAKHEAKIFFKENGLSSSDIAQLNKLSLVRLNLRLVQQD